MNFGVFCNLIGEKCYLSVVLISISQMNECEIFMFKSHLCFLFCGVSLISFAYFVVGVGERVCLKTTL